MDAITRTIQRRCGRMKQLQVTEQNKPYYSADYTKGFNDGAKAQYEADKKEAERRGRWILKYGDGHIEKSIVGGECSLCGFVGPATRYCPNCGAKMGEVKE